MCIITQWFWKLRAQRQLLEARKKAEAEEQAQRKKVEIERQARRENQDYEHRRSLQLSLQGLQDVMDPLIASQAYNNRFCPLTRLPEELLLNILDFLRYDDVTLYCLRWTSRIFLRLLHRQSGFWGPRYYVFSPMCMDYFKMVRLRRLAEKDARCENCRRWNARQKHNVQPCKFRESRLREKPIHQGCEDWMCDYSRPYCSVCGTNHDICQFPMAYQMPPQLQDPRPQVCVGQLGSVQLCKHVYITWDTIKAHIDGWRRQRGGVGACAESDWRACLESFSIECHDATHDMRCLDCETPSWPRARLGTWGGYCSNDLGYVILYLEWSPHGRIDSLKPTADGRIPAAELRALFRKFRRLGPADRLYPPGFPETLPEMACLRHNFPIYYKMGDEEEPSPTSSSPSAHLNQRQLANRCRSLTGTSPVGWNSRRLDISPHYLSGATGPGIASQCLAVRYQKGIMICRIEALTDPAVKLVPSDPWLHAMDTRTYPHQQATSFRPQCKDASCTNYYQRAKHHRACLG